MQENTNKAIAINSIIMYLRMGINIILALFTTRFALQALGVMDYGLFSVVGSIITFISVFNTIMISTCNRFLAVAIGKGDIIEINKTFNVNICIFIGCAIVFAFLAIPAGMWYINTNLNYDGNIDNARFVFLISIVGSIISTLASPYNGLLIAKERFLMFSAVDVLLHVIRFVVVVMLVYYFEEKLTIYTYLNAVTIALPSLLYAIYCRKLFPDIVEWKIVKDRQMYKDVFSFSGWVAYGAFASVVRQQGAAVLVNMFFNTVMNTALGIANSLNNYILMFANNLTQPIQPQITKSYASGNIERTNELLVMSTKYSFLLMLAISTPFFVEREWLISLWLGSVPEYAATFTVLLIVDNLILSFNSGINVIIFASGKIALYQVVINTLRLAAVVAAYYSLKIGSSPYYLFASYITLSLIIVVSTQWCLHKTLDYDTTQLIRKSYIPSICVLICMLPVYILNISIHPLIHIILAMAILAIVEFFVGLSKKERLFIVNRFNKINKSNI